MTKARILRCFFVPRLLVIIILEGKRKSCTPRNGRQQPKCAIVELQNLEVQRLLAKEFLLLGHRHTQKIRAIVLTGRVGESLRAVFKIITCFRSLLSLWASSSYFFQDLYGLSLRINKEWLMDSVFVLSPLATESSEGFASIQPY